MKHWPNGELGKLWIKPWFPAKWDLCFLWNTLLIKHWPNVRVERAYESNCGKLKSWESYESKLRLITKWHLFFLWEQFTNQALTKCKSQANLWIKLWFITRDIQNSYSSPMESTCPNIYEKGIKSMSMSFQLVSVITSHYLSMKESCLFGFSRSNLLNHGTSCHSFGTIGKLSMSTGAPIGFIMFQPTMEKLLNIEQFFHFKFTWIKH